ncbi:Transcription regulator with HTH domain [Nostoc sp. DSM 114161]|jgi:HTH-type transcriptional regulator/antitoxin HigA|uniref:helix-turn-helix domain-containing protein n=1 Tax=Nostoc sp. DSM 114161 TaxID=3440143 RepID=UPI00404665C7
MTLTFNFDKYRELLIAYLPKLIKTEAENAQALKLVEDLMHQKLTPEEDELYQLLITLIEKFEQEYYQPSQQNNSVSMLLFILEESERSRDDLVAVLGTEELVDNILNGQKKINTEQARKLGEFFHVEPSLFME